MSYGRARSWKADGNLPSTAVRQNLRVCAVQRRCQPAVVPPCGTADSSICDRCAEPQPRLDEESVRWLGATQLTSAPVRGCWRRWGRRRTPSSGCAGGRGGRRTSERLTDWEQRAEQARERRHRRRMAWITAPLDVARTAAVMAMSMLGLLLGLGGILAIAHRDPAWLLTPVQKAVDTVAWLVWLLDLVWLPVTMALPFLLLGGLWQLGRRHGQVPRWAAPGGVREHPTVIVTPGGAATALAHLGIPAMNRAVKDGWQVEFATPPVRVNGRGYDHVQPADGRDPGDGRRQRDVLARNWSALRWRCRPSRRADVCRAQRARRLCRSVGGRSGLDRAAGAALSAVVRGRCGRVRGGAVGGVAAGEVIAPALPGANVAFGGVMGQGKSNAARVVMAGAALDPLAELWVFVFANNGDFDAYQPRLARYHRGVDEQTTRAAVEALHALYAEVGRREARLAELGAKKLTRPLAEKHPACGRCVRCSPSCHALFATPRRREAGDLAVQTCAGTARPPSARFDTQSSRATRFPPKIVELVRLTRVSRVKSWRSNDGSSVTVVPAGIRRPSCGWVRTWVRRS